MEGTAAEGSSIELQAVAFQRRLAKIKADLGEREFPWYRYDSLSNVGILERLLQGRFRVLLDRARDTRLLDIGCADGDLSFFLESLGFTVTAIDYPGTNHNGMRGVRKLKEVLNSRVEILEADIDSRFQLPDTSYDLVIVLGLLYHLKNPYYLLELLAQHARFCLLSTRVARYAPDGTEIRDIPVGYLLRADELNHDPTNYWIFSEAGLKQLIGRTGWQACHYTTVGDTKQSRPHTQENDERAFCLMRNRRRVDPAYAVRLGKGWHELEGGHWRWTEKSFSVEMPTTEIRRDAVLELEFVYADVLKERTESLQVQAFIGNTALPPATYTTSGIHFYRASVPVKLLTRPAVVVRFEADQALPPDSVDLRERSLIVLSVGLDPA